jgi:serine/threonine protein phosphatase PrpC
MFGRKRKELEREKRMVTAQSSHKIVRKVPEIIALSYTATGNRKYQQDAVYISGSRKIAGNRKTRVFAAVCDGMGGMADGGRASSTAIHMFREGFEKIEKEPNIQIPTFFRQGIRSVDAVISQFPKEAGKGSGTTLVAVIAENNRLYWASVGDSRIYILRGRDMIQVTRDHNYMLRLQQMVDNGQMTLQEAQAKKQKEALISFLGIGNVTLMDINEQPFEMQFGDIVLLCSDGITKTLPDDQIRDIIKNDAVSMKEKAKILVEAAVRGNTHSQDNTSVAILQYVETEIGVSRPS